MADTDVTSSKSIEPLETRRLLSGVRATQASYPVNMTPQDVVAADFNGDGRADLAVLGAGGGGVALLLGQNDGSFAAARQLQIGKPWQIAAGDFNRDGAADIAAIDSGDHITIYPGRRDGTFRVSETLRVPHAADLVAGDFNADGRDDLAVATTLGNGNGLTVIFNRGNHLDGARRAVGGSEGAGWVEQMIVADLNGDGRDDVTTIDDVGGVHAYVARSKGDRFAAAKNQWFGRQASGFALADLDGDKKADLVVGGWGLSAADPNFTGEIDILKGNGDGTFATARGIAVDGYGGALAATDANGDGSTDLVLVTASSPMRVLFNDGKANFATSEDVNPGDAMRGAWSSAIFPGDVNGDGRPDLLQLNSDTDSAVVTTLA